MYVVTIGVLCLHQGVVSLQSSSMEGRLHSKPGRRIAQFMSTGFDVCVHEVFASLCYGATLVLRKDDDDPFSHLADVDVVSMNATVAGSLDPSEYPDLDYVCPPRSRMFVHRLTRLELGLPCWGANPTKNSRQMGSRSRAVQCIWTNRGAYHFSTPSANDHLRCLTFAVIHN